MAITYEPISTTTLGSNSQTVSFTSISGSYTDLVVVISGVISNQGANATNPNITFNSDTGSNYSVTWIYGDGSSAGSGRQSSQTKALFGGFTTVRGMATIQIQNYSNTTTYKTFISRNSVTDSATGQAVSAWAGLWRSTSAITSFTLDSGRSDAPWASGTMFTIYGIKSA